MLRTLKFLKYPQAANLLEDSFNGEARVFSEKPS